MQDVTTDALSLKQQRAIARKNAMMAFLRSWQFSLIVAILAASVMVLGQAKQREKNEALTASQGDVLTIPAITIVDKK